MLKTKKTGISFRLLPVFAGVIYASIFFVAGHILAGLLYYLTPLAEETLPWMAGSIYFASVLAASALVTFRAGGKGLYYGLSVAAGFFFLARVLETEFFPSSSWTFTTAQQAALALTSGIAGGMLGAFLTPGSE
jgi:putative membrane protein (TIGR04086 family)